MPLATDADVETALGRVLTSDEADRVDILLEQASDRVIGYLGGRPDPVVGAVARVTAEMVAAVFLKPSVTVANYDATGYATAREYAQVTVGTESATSIGPWLTKTQKLALAPWRIGVRSVGMISETSDDP